MESSIPRPSPSVFMISAPSEKRKGKSPNLYENSKLRRAGMFPPFFFGLPLASINSFNLVKPFSGFFGYRLCSIITLKPNRVVLVTIETSSLLELDRIIQGDSLTALKSLPNSCVNLIFYLTAIC